MKTQRRVRSVVLVLVALSFAAGAAGQTAPAAPGSSRRIRRRTPRGYGSWRRPRRPCSTRSSTATPRSRATASASSSCPTATGCPQLYVSDAARPDSAVTRLVSSTERVSGPLALADGKRVLFRSDAERTRTGRSSSARSDGGGAAAELTAGTKRQRDAPIVPDGAPNTAFYSGRTMSASGSGGLLARADARRAREEALRGHAARSLSDVSRDGQARAVDPLPDRDDNTLLSARPRDGSREAHLSGGGEAGPDLRRAVLGRRKARPRRDGRRRGAGARPRAGRERPRARAATRGARRRRRP
jgi:hypothetical protein